ncbi:MAG: transglycosylase SLT domain-containing protein [Gammaproteobacteria bacterium]|nr:transglycosylase SLT domain-containing protein [Gammaproteobacteria bacterium]
MSRNLRFYFKLLRQRQSAYRGRFASLTSSTREKAIGTVKNKHVRRRFAVALLALSMLTGAGVAAGWYEDRALYKRAVTALRANNINQFEKHVAELGDYPLVPYLHYLRALTRLSRTNTAEAIAYRDAMGEYTFGDRFMAQWLKVQAARGRWRDYVEHYQPTSDIVAQCRYALALIRTGDRQTAYALLPQLWNVGESQDESCDPAFEIWIRDGGISSELAWERMKKALDARQYSLSRYIMRFMSADVKRSAELMYAARRNPRIVANVSQFPNDHWGNDALLYGLSSLARTDSTRAFSLWKQHGESRAFDEFQTTSSVSDLYLWLALEGHVGLPRRSGISTRSLERVIHSAVSKNAWQEAEFWMNELPAAERAKYQWRYWQARTDKALGRESWKGALQSLAQERTYYGFLAAQDLGLPVNLNEQSYRGDRENEAKLAANPHARMVLEFFAVGEPDNGRREWRKLEESLTDEEKMVMINWFNEFGLSNEAIFAANRGEMLNFLEVRFPTPFLSYFKKGAFVADVPLSFLLALSRQESAFDHRAISRAGARGLMQLMLPTARATARNHGLARPSNDSLLDPRRNIEIGSLHIAELASEFADNRILIAASYNAGKHRTYAWLRDYKVQDAPSFIEIIPFRETREYVKGVLAFAVVYATRNGDNVQLLSSNELQLPTHLFN